MAHDQKSKSDNLKSVLDHVRLLRRVRKQIPRYGEETLDEIFRRWQKLRSPQLSLVPEPYEPRWPAWFAQEKDRFHTTLAELRPAIEHFGSTAVPGLPSKRVIDLAVAVTDPEDAEEGLTSLGYVSYGNSPVDTDTTWFWRSEDPRCVFVAHLCRQGRLWLKRALDFRDFLRAHPAERNRYAALKERLAADAAGDSLRFSLGKIELLHEIFSRAASWREETEKDNVLIERQ